jgi:ECF transporter S component (folate family)
MVVIEILGERMTSLKNESKFDVKQICAMAILIAISIVLGRFFSIRTPVVTIGFGFLPVVIAAVLYGPLVGGLVGAAADFIGAVLFPIAAFFPGFTLTAFLTGAIYGILLHRKERSAMRILAAVAITIVLGDLILNTYWLTVIMGESMLALLPARIGKSLIMLPVRFLSIQLIDRRLIDEYILPILRPAWK